MKIVELILKNLSVPAASVKTTTLPEDFFARGQAFSHSDYYEFDASETKNFVFDPTAYVPPGIDSLDRIIALIPKIDSTGGPVLVDFYAGCQANSNGTLLNIFNRDGKSTNVNQSVLRLNPTKTAPGAKFSGLLNPATSVGVIGQGNSLSDELPFAIDSDLKYCMEVTNTNGAGVRVGFRFTWFEI